MKTGRSVCPINPASASNSIAKSFASTANSTSISAATLTIRTQAAPAGHPSSPTIAGQIPKTIARFRSHTKCHPNSIVGQIANLRRVANPPAAPVNHRRADCQSAPQLSSRGTLTMLRYFLLIANLLFALHAESGADAWVRHAPLDEASARQYATLPAAVVTFTATPPAQSAQSELLR